MQKTILFIALVLLSWGCEKENNYIIPEDKMVDLLVDLQITEGLISSNLSNFSNNESKIIAYQKVYDKHHVDEARFDSSLAYYSESIERYELIYDSLITKLMQLETEVKAGLYYQPDFFHVDSLVLNEFRQDSILKDSVLREFWTLERSFYFSDTTENEHIHFDIEIDTLKGFQYLLVARIRLEADSSSSSRMEMRVEYRDSSADVAFLPLVKDSVLNLYKLYLPLDSGKMPSMLRGGFLFCDSCPDTFSGQIESIRLYEMGSSQVVSSRRFKGFLSIH